MAVGDSVDLLATVVACTEWGWWGVAISAVYWWFRKALRVERNAAAFILRGAVLRWLGSVSDAPAMLTAVRMALELAGGVMLVIGFAAITLDILIDSVRKKAEPVMRSIFVLLLRSNRSLRFNPLAGTVEFFDIVPPPTEVEEPAASWHLEDVDAACALDHGKECPVECAICFKTPTLWRTLPCEHVFCAACADAWLMLHGTCPMCRHVVLHHAGTASV